MLEDTRQKVLSTSERITTLTAELNDGNSKIEEMKAEFNRIVSVPRFLMKARWRSRKMICGYIIKRFRCSGTIESRLNSTSNVEQFLNGIDSIDECDTYEEIAYGAISSHPRHDHGEGYISKFDMAS